MNHPTWGDVKTPAALVDFIKGVKPCYFLDSLVHQFVFHNRRKTYHTYICDTCGFTHRPERATEELACCPNCNSVDIRSVTPQLRWNKEIPRYSRNLNYNLNPIFTSMTDNYVAYFHRFPHDFACGWRYNTPYTQFPGGDITFDDSPQLSIIKAAVLVPYLWDMSFNWGDLDDKMNTEQLSPILHYFSHKNYFKSTR